MNHRRELKLDLTLGVGWDLGLLGLAPHLDSWVTIDPSEAAAWSVSDEAKQFITLSSEAWLHASIAAGTHPDLAQAAAECTTAFYTGTTEASRGS